MKVDIVNQTAKIMNQDRNKESDKTLLAEPAVSRPVSGHIDAASAVGQNAAVGERRKVCWSSAFWIPRRIAINHRCGTADNLHSPLILGGS